MKKGKLTTRGQASRERLHRAALSCFVAQGVEGATTKSIARAAKMAEGNLYRHYPSKEDLAWAIYARELGRFVAALAEAARLPAGTRERLGALVHCFRVLFERETDAYTFIVLAQQPLLKRTPKGMRTPTDVLREVLEEGQKRGEVRPGSASLFAVLLVGMVIRATLLKLKGWVEEDLDALEREVVEACWRVVRMEKQGGTR